MFSFIWGSNILLLFILIIIRLIRIKTEIIIKFFQLWTLIIFWITKLCLEHRQVNRFWWFISKSNFIKTIIITIFSTYHIFRFPNQIHSLNSLPRLSRRNSSSPWIIRTLAFSFLSPITTHASLRHLRNCGFLYHKWIYFIWWIISLKLFLLS